MNRNKFLNGVKALINPADVVFCVGKTLGSEFPDPDDQIIFIANEYVDIISIAIGIAMGTDKKVLIIAEDQFILSNMNAMMQAAVSKCTNLYFLIAVSTLYDPLLAQNNLFGSIRSVNGVLVSAGILVHEYSRYFETKTAIKSLKSFYKSTIGPALGFVAINNNRLYTANKNYKVMETLSNVFEFISNKELVSSLQEPPNRNMFDLESIMKDK